MLQSLLLDSVDLYRSSRVGVCCTSVDFLKQLQVKLVLVDFGILRATTDWIWRLSLDQMTSHQRDWIENGTAGRNCWRCE